MTSRGMTTSVIAMVAAMGAAALFVRPALAQAPEKIGAASCANCHQERMDSFKTSLHARSFAERKGIALEQACETCHGAGSKHAEAAGDKANPGFATIKNPAKLSAKDVNGICLTCHESGDRMFWRGGQHESRNVSCAACHSVHQPESAGKHALLKTDTAAETCYGCHKDKKAQMERSAHMPVREGKMSCVDCHTPHGSATPRQLKGEDVNATCSACHADKRGPFLWEHPPVRETCLNCHAPHGSHQERALTVKKPFLCQRCHVGTRHPTTEYDLSQVTQEVNRVIGKGCTNCHSAIHGSNHPSGKLFLR